MNFSAYIKDTVNHGKGYWGDYDYFNKKLPKETTRYLEIQLQNLRQVEAKDDYSEINAFLNSAEFKDAWSKEFEESVFSTIMKTINRVFISSENSIQGPGTKSKHKKKNGKEVLVNDRYNIYEIGKSGYDTTVSEQLNLLKEELQAIMTKARGGTISKSDAKMLNNLSKALKFKNKAIKQQFNLEKSSYAEGLTTDILNQAGILDFYNTGAIQDKLGQAIIQDVMGYKKGASLGGNGVSLTYTVAGSNSPIEFKGTVEEFFKEVEKISKKNQTIQIGDELYDALTSAASFKGQVKSGIKQDILNSDSKQRNAISLADLGFKDPSVMKDSVLKPGYELWELYDMAAKTKKWAGDGRIWEDLVGEPDGESNSMAVITNYLLSKEIAKTNITKNNAYITTEGIMPASEWMAKHSKHLEFRPNITKFSTSILEQAHPYRFTGV